VVGYACEPIPPIFEVLTANVSSHKLPTKLFNVGISRERGDAEFTYYKHNSALSGRYADPGDEHRLAKTILSNKKPNLKEKHLDALLTDKFESERFQCSLVTLSSIIQEDRIERIDLLKVDVEKSEADVFAGIVDPHWALIRQVVVEVHDHEGRLSTITTLLRGKGFEVVAVQNPSFKGTDIYDVYAVRPS
jgi:FkbM family methyltransferase